VPADGAHQQPQHPGGEHRQPCAVEELREQDHHRDQAGEHRADRVDDPGDVLALP